MFSFDSFWEKCFIKLQYTETELSTLPAWCLHYLVKYSCCYIFNLPTGAVAKYCDEHICLSVCLSVWISPEPRAIFPNFSVHVAYGRGSVLWQGDEIPRGRGSFSGFLPHWHWGTHHISTVSHLGSVTARHFISGRQPNFAALNRGRHLYSAGRPSSWALAHISSCLIL